MARFANSEYPGKKAKTMRLSDDCRRLLTEAGKRYNLSVTEVVEKMTRGELDVTPREKPLLADVLESDEQLAIVYKSNAQVRDLMKKLWSYA